LHSAIQKSLVIDKPFTSNPSEGSMCVSQVLQYLAELIEEYQFYSIFADNRDEIFVDIILNLLTTTKVDYGA